MKKWSKRRVIAILLLTLIGAGIWGAGSVESLQATNKRELESKKAWNDLPERTEIGEKGTGAAVSEESEQMIDSDFIGPNPLQPLLTGNERADAEWLPEYGKWLNSETEVIPKENSVVLRYSKGYTNDMGELVGKTEVVGHSEEIDLDIPGTQAPGTVALPFNESAEEQFLVFSNVGYSDGNTIAVKMRIKPSNKYNTVSIGGCWVGISESKLFDVQISRSVESTTIIFEFLIQTDDSAWETWKPLKLSGYWTVSNLLDTKDIIVPLDLIDHVYSIDRDYIYKGNDAPTYLKYQEELSTGSLILSSVGQNPDDPNLTYKVITQKQVAATMTYTNSTQFQYTIVPNAVKAPNGGYYTPKVLYDSSTFAKVAIPDPIGLIKVFNPITVENYKNPAGEISTPLNYEFMQSIPYESVENRTQKMEWTIPNNSNPSLSEALSEVPNWKIFNENGVDASNYFKIVGTKISPTDLAYNSTGFYNHYYFFQKDMTIRTENKVNNNVLQPYEGAGQYLDYTGDIIRLEVTDEGRDIPPVLAQPPFHSYINFEAVVTYEFYDEDEVLKYSYDSSTFDYATDLTGLPYITYEAPLLSPAKRAELDSVFENDGYKIAAQAPTYELVVADSKTPPPSGVTHQLQCTEGNVVKYRLRDSSLPDEPEDYQVAIKVVDQERDLLVADARTLFTITDSEKNPVSGNQLIIGETYTIKQTTRYENYLTAEENEYYEEEKAIFEVVINEHGLFTITKPEPPHGIPYSFEMDAETGLLTITVVNVLVEEPGEITWEVPPLMDFGEVKVPVRKALDQYLIQDNEPWQIKVTDERKSRDPWRISARIESEFVSAANNQVLPSILKFKDGTVDQTLTTTAPVEIYQSKAQPEVATTIDWQSPEGFYLGLKALGSYPLGQANATIEFVLITEP